MSPFHTTPRPETVADVWDYCGSHFAQERWGHLGAETVGRLARARRLAAGRPYAGQGLRHVLSEAHDLLSRGWDGAAPAEPVDLAAALGLPLSTLQDP